MEIDNKYLKKLLAPLCKTVSLSPSEYQASLKAKGISIENPPGYIDDKFKRHFEHLISSGHIKNSNGGTQMKDFGFYIGADNTLTLIEPSRISKTSKPESFLHKIAIFYAAFFIAVFISHSTWRWALNKFGMESIIYWLSIAFPSISAMIALVYTARHWSDKHVLQGQVFGLLMTCYCSYFLYRRTKGLEAQFWVTRIAPSDGNVGCLTDFIVVGCAIMVLLMQSIFP